MLRTGQRVYLRAAPHNAGTVSRVTPVSFRVIYDDPARKPGKPRPMYTYPLGAEERFAPGRPAPQD